MTLLGITVGHIQPLEELSLTAELQTFMFSPHSVLLLFAPTPCFLQLFVTTVLHVFKKKAPHPLCIHPLPQHCSTLSIKPSNTADHFLGLCHLLARAQSILSDSGIWALWSQSSAPEKVRASENQRHAHSPKEEAVLDFPSNFPVSNHSVWIYIYIKCLTFSNHSYISLFSIFESLNSA